jgi:hypothetical protein
MAILKTLKFKNIDIANAYVRIHRVDLNKNEMMIVCRFHKDKDSEFFDGVDVSAEYDLDGENPFKQAYDHLKTLPEFAGATDC